MTLKIDYDSLWKEIISEFFEDFVAFFLPDMYLKIDFTKPVDFLEQELLDIFKTKYKGKRINDKLVKVHLKDGTEKWLLIHIEVQASFEKEFAERMFLYYALIYTKYEIKDISAIAIFTTNAVPLVNNHFTHTLFGTTISYKYNIYKIREQNEADLLPNPNPFSLAVLANLQVLYTSDNMEERLSQKEKLFKIAKNRGFEEKKLIRLLIFVRYLMVLPKDLEFQFQKEVAHDYQNIKNMSAIKLKDVEFAENVYAAVFGINPRIFIDHEIKKGIREGVKLGKEKLKKREMRLEEKLKKFYLKEHKKFLAEQERKYLEDREKMLLIEAEAEKQKAEADTRLTRSILNFYEKNQFEGLAAFCELLEIEYTFAETIIQQHLAKKKDF